ncbi:MAG: hypothetical protein FKY71_08300 [Spiribacter salinus]|uniref:Phage neck terminator protein gp12-like domain-containing protein n=1 Tax=Spiribacter salinus TaxID=1335746 RepID=A0A540VRU7_9GAMM|nr:MAG: hypothetical protein FKY71_08300 [Spiribacter salinus]
MSDTEAIRQWVATETGLETVWLHPNAPRPARPYAAVQVLSSPRLGEPYVGWPDGTTGAGEVAGQTESTFSIHIYEAASAPDPRAALMRVFALRNTLDKPTVREYFRVNQWAFRAVEMITDSPELLDTSWESRAMFDVRFGSTATQSDDLGVIETAVVNNDPIAEEDA